MIIPKFIIPSTNHSDEDANREDSSIEHTVGNQLRSKSVSLIKHKSQFLEGGIRFYLSSDTVFVSH